MIIKKACPVTGQAKTYIPPLQHTIICVPITGKPAYPTVNSDCNSGVIFIRNSVPILHHHRLAETSVRDYSLHPCFYFITRDIIITCRYSVNAGRDKSQSIYGFMSNPFIKTMIYPVVISPIPFLLNNKQKFLYKFFVFVT